MSLPTGMTLPHLALRVSQRWMEYLVHSLGIHNFFQSRMFIINEDVLYRAISPRFRHHEPLYAIMIGSYPHFDLLSSDACILIFERQGTLGTHYRNGRQLRVPAPEKYATDNASD